MRLQAGQALQRIVLTAAPVPQALGTPERRQNLRGLLGGALWPQVVFRTGHATATASAWDHGDLSGLLTPPQTDGPTVAALGRATTRALGNA
ncbi:hypothetical protein ACIA5G_49650 [Amycolatopsis sp. NPDC051758]|uniref:hypothetical protein n=1 Tax=Amycolatopsis sp. NPDC051758 TaxID=3363935 RepID=UPI0037BBAD47